MQLQESVSTYVLPQVCRHHLPYKHLESTSARNQMNTASRVSFSETKTTLQDFDFQYLASISRKSKYIYKRSLHKVISEL